MSDRIRSDQVGSGRNRSDRIQSGSGSYSARSGHVESGHARPSQVESDRIRSGQVSVGRSPGGARRRGISMESEAGRRPKLSVLQRRDSWGGGGGDGSESRRGSAGNSQSTSRAWLRKLKPATGPAQWPRGAADGGDARLWPRPAHQTS